MERADILLRTSKKKRKEIFIFIPESLKASKRYESKNGNDYCRNLTDGLENQSLLCFEIFVYIMLVYEKMGCLG